MNGVLNGIYLNNLTSINHLITILAHFDYLTERDREISKWTKSTQEANASFVP